MRRAWRLVRVMGQVKLSLRMMMRDMDIWIYARYKLKTALGRIGCCILVEFWGCDEEIV